MFIWRHGGHIGVQNNENGGHVGLQKKILWGLNTANVKNCICSNKFALLLTTRVKTIYTNHWVLSCYRWVTTSAFCSRWRILLTTKDLKTKHPFGRLAWLTWTSTFTTWTRSRGSGCIWSPSLAEELYLESRDGLREWMMISGLLYSKNPQVRTYIFWS